MQTPENTLLLLKATVESLERSLEPNQRIIFRFGETDMLVGRVELFNETFFQFFGSIDDMPAIMIQSFLNLNFSLRIETVSEDQVERAIVGFEYHPSSES